MSTPTSGTYPPLLREPPDFSLVSGGPLFQLWRRTRLSGDSLQLPQRRVLVLVALAWLPLLVLSIASGTAWGAGVELTFLKDVEVHVRLLVALPLLIAAERSVHQMMRPVIRAFLDRNLVAGEARTGFDAAIDSAMRLRNSVAAELLMLAFVYVVGVGLVWRNEVALDVTSWYGTPVDGRLHPSTAGWWLGCVSLPMLQFLLLRWYYRLFLMARFFWQVARMDLDIVPTHPDRCGGLGFLALVSKVFAPLMFAQGVLLAGMIASRIFHAGATLPQFKTELLGMVVLMLLVVLGPLLVFSPRLAAAKRRGQMEYGALAQRYVQDYDRKWLRGGAPKDEAFLGSGDIQSLADLGGGFERVDTMRVTPFTLQSALLLAAATLAPVLPLTLTMFSLQELLNRLMKVVF
jgi:hypothetical protein